MKLRSKEQEDKIRKGYRSQCLETSVRILNFILGAMESD